MHTLSKTTFPNVFESFTGFLHAKSALTNFKRYMVWEDIQEVMGKTVAFQHHLMNKFLVVDIWHDIVVMMQGTFERAFELPDHLYAKLVKHTLATCTT